MITDEELEELSEMHVLKEAQPDPNSGTLGAWSKAGCAAQLDDACYHTEEWPCRTRRLIDAYRQLLQERGR